MADPATGVLEVEDIWEYLRGRGLVAEDSTGSVREVGDGNMNRVVLAVPDGGGPGVAVKQAPPWIRVRPSTRTSLASGQRWAT